MRWYVRSVRVQPGVKEDQETLEELLADHWEPFAVTQGRISPTYHLRRRGDDEQA